MVPFFRGALAALAVAANACNRSPSPSPAARMDASADALAPVVRPFLDRAGVPAIAYAAVTREGATVGAVGDADLIGLRSATADTPFQAASIGKTVIATCVMQLVAAGQMSLDADVSSYVGMRVAHPHHTRPITLRMLLAHTSSIVDDLTKLQASADVPLSDFLRRYLREGGAFGPDEPGSRMRYSNVGAALAALAVEHVAGQPFAVVTRERVFVPLKMTSSAWRAADLPGAPARGHAGRDATPPPSHAVYPVVDLFSSARDLSRFARAILRGGELDGARILPADATTEMFRASEPGDALGWQLRTFGSARVVGHEGEDLGASTGMYLDLERGTGAVVLANGNAFASGDRARAAALGELVEALLTPR